LLKQKTSASKIWITRKLNVGTPDADSLYESEFKARGGDTKIDFSRANHKGNDMIPFYAPSKKLHKHLNNSIMRIPPR
jgi:hypothetical protein